LSEEIESVDASSEEIKFVMLMKLEQNSSLIVSVIVARDVAFAGGLELEQRPKYMVVRALQASSANVARCLGEQEQQH